MNNNTLIGDGEVRIMSDAFEDTIIKKRLHREGYRLYLWNQWVALWKGAQYVCRNSDGTLYYGSKEDLIGTREDFEEYLDELRNSIS